MHTCSGQNLKTTPLSPSIDAIPNHTKLKTALFFIRGYFQHFLCSWINCCPLKLQPFCLPSHLPKLATQKPKLAKQKQRSHNRLRPTRDWCAGVEVLSLPSNQPATHGTKSKPLKLVRPTLKPVYKQRNRADNTAFSQPLSEAAATN